MMYNKVRMCETDFFAWKWTLLFICLIILLFVGRWKLANQKKWQLQNLQIKWNAAGKDVVVLHQLPRSQFCPNLSPYALKLETFLRLHAIKFLNDFSKPMSQKNKTPWITINGENIADSQLCIEYLAEKFKLDINQGLSDQELIVSRALRFMIEQDLFWVLAHDRLVINQAKFLPQFIGKDVLDLVVPWFFKGFPRPVQEWLFKQAFMKLGKQTSVQGMGRHTEAEVQAMGFKDIECLSGFLGDKEFLFGKDHPTEIDCVLFGFMCIILYCTPKDNVYTQKVLRHHQNLVAYTKRLKEKLWPDWNQCLFQD